MNRTIIIAAIVLVLLGGGAAVYYFFFANQSGVSVAPSGTATLPSAGGAGAPSQGSGGSLGSGGSGGSASVAVTTRLTKITDGPVVPGESVTTKRATASSTADTTIRFIARESGNVYSYSSAARTLTRTSNKTIPGIQSSSWLPDGSLAFVRYLSGDDSSTINTYGLPATGTGGFFLPQDLDDVAVASTSVLTLASGVNGSTASVVRPDGSRTVAAFSTPLSSLRASFAGKQQYLAVTKAASTLSGDAFIVDAAGRFTRVAGPLNGLVAIASPSGKWVLASYVQNGEMQLELVNVATGETTQLPIATIADKCAWSADDSVIYCGVPDSPPTNASYPDDWYQGAVHFSDRIWRIQVTGRYAQLVLDFSKDAKADLDAEALTVDAANTTLVFFNKNDGSLWSYAL